MRTLLALGCYLIAKGCLRVAWAWIALAQRIEPMPVEEPEECEYESVVYGTTPTETDAERIAWLTGDWAGPVQ